MKKSIKSFPTIEDKTLSSVVGGKFSLPLPSWTQLVDSVKGLLDGVTGHKRHYD